MIIHLDPVLVTLGPLILTWHGLFSAIGVAIGVYLAGHFAKNSGIDEDDYYTAALWTILGGAVGARTLFVLENWSYFATSPMKMLAINEGGISIYGAVLGGTLTALLIARRMKLHIPTLADSAAAPVILGQGIGRIGDIINGEHHGMATDLPFGVVYTHPNTLGEIGANVHLAVGYEMLYDFAVFGILLYLRGKLPRQGMLYLLYLFLYSLGRLWVGFFRKDTDVLLGLGMAQVIAVIIMLVTAAWLVRWSQRSQRPTRAARRAR
ncbi:MAG: lgt [Dehalococcoidia bacterium]|nr:lgt [Dehalococcoidia bacterium]